MPSNHAAIKFIFPFLNIFTHSSVMFRKDTLEDALYYNESKCTFNDYHLFLDLLFNQSPEGHQFKFAIIPEILVLSLVHNDSLSNKRPEEDYVEMDAKRNKVMRQVYQSINADDVFDEFALMGITCLMNNHDGCVELPTKITLVEIFLMLEEFYKKETGMTHLERKELGQYIYSWKIRAAKQEAKKQKVQKDNEKRTT